MSVCGGDDAVGVHPLRTRGLTLPGLFADVVRRVPDEMAIVDADGERTWAAWAEEVEAVARGLQEAGVAPGDVVAVQLPNCTDLETVHLAAARVGAVLLPVHAGYGSADVLALLARVEPLVVVLAPPSQAVGEPLRADALCAAAPSLRLVLIAGWDGEAGGIADAGRIEDRVGAVGLAELRGRWAGQRPRPVTVRPEMPLVLLPSSATTSARPKICEHSHDGLLSNTAALALDGADAGGCGVVMVASTLTHLFGLQAMYTALLTGSAQALPGPWDVERFLEMAERVEPALVFAVPTQLYDIVSSLRRSGRVAGFRPREVRTAGAVLPASLAADVQDVMGAAVVVVWGMSEIGYGTHTRPDEPSELSGTVGRPTRGSEVRVVDAAGAACPAGVVGDLQYRGPGLFRGYVGEPELTRAAMTVDGWLRTGDTAAVAENGLLLFHGRSSELINVGGQKFNVAEIESLLSEWPGLGPVAVVARPDPRLGEYPCLVLTRAAAAPADLSAVVDFLRERGVAEYKIPLDIAVIESLPRTPAGKLDRRGLETTLSRAEDEPVPVQPSVSYTEALALVRKSAATVLGRTPEHITVDGPLRSQGLNSLLAVRLATLLAEATGLPLPASLAFDFPTPTAIANLLTNPAPPTTVA